MGPAFRTPSASPDSSRLIPPPPVLLPSPAGFNATAPPVPAGFNATAPPVPRPPSPPPPTAVPTMDNHAASTVADGQPLAQPLLLPSPLPPPAPPLSLSLACPFCVVSPASASTVPTSPAPMCFEGWYKEVEAVTEGVNNLAITEQHKKNQIQVSNTKKQLFFYVNLAKLHKHQRGYASLCEKLLGAKDGGVSSNSSQSDAAVSIPSSPIPVNGKLVE